MHVGSVEQAPGKCWPWSCLRGLLVPPTSPFIMATCLQVRETLPHMSWGC